MSVKRLSKDECTVIAEKMTGGILTQINAINSWFNNLHRQVAVKNVPETIMSLFSGDSKLAKYINSGSFGTFHIDGNRYHYTDFEPVPINSNNWRIVHSVPDEFVKEANDKYDKLKALQTKRQILKDEIKEVLYKLGSYKKISESLPEAVPFLPKVEEVLLPAMNLSQFREKLRDELKGFE